jgi:hypothetical protein
VLAAAGAHKVEAELAKLDRPKTIGKQQTVSRLEITLAAFPSEHTVADTWNFSKR